MRIQLLFLALISQFTFGQVTFIVNDLPDDHDYSKDIYISGDFEGWSGGREELKLTKKDNSYQITINEDIPCNLLFKFTLGSWESVEVNEDGLNRENRSYSCNDEEQLVYISIANWTNANKTIVKSTAHKNVEILSEAFEIPQLNKSRRIWVYLPPDYETSNKNYPVLYMHDGQNVFDVKTSYAGEWEVDETLNKLYYEANLSMIVVAIDNADEERVNEYIPYNFDRIDKSEGKDYVKFIAETLKPYVDNNYRTLTDSNNTAIMGSSLGGLISHYAGLEFPEVFGKVGVFSPSFWVSEEVFDLASSKGNLENSRMYFLAGDRESENMVPNMDKMIKTMVASGFNTKNQKSKIVSKGQHNEKLWRDNFEEAILWLFEKEKPIRNFESLEENKDELIVNVSDGQYIIKFYSSQIVETSFIPNGQALKSKSHAVVLKPEELNIEINSTDNSTSVTTGGIEINMEHFPFKITYNYNGRPITSEKQGYHKTEYGEAISLNITEDEILYGGGARALGMNRRGNRLQLYNRAHYGYETESALMNYTMPIVISSNKYMVHFDNAPIGYLDLDSKRNNTLTYETISGRKTYQIVVGRTWEELIDNYTDLTGKQPLPPRWALGNFSSRFGYHSEKETKETVAKFKDEEIPLDAVIIDIYWFGKDIQGHMGNLQWLRDSFPNPKQMMKDFKKQGVKTILVTEPFVLTTSKRWKEAVDKNVLAKDSLGNPYTFDFYFGNTGLIDVYNPKSRAWFWDIYKNLDIMGVEGIWGDLGEPEVHPEKLLHATGTANEVHNIYGHDWARLIYEGYANDFPHKRPFILMRSGYSGSQRFGLIPWSGDVNRTWGGLQSQVEIALQMAMQGLAYIHSDLGGFAGANLDDELYTRWLQYGVFQPIYRPHAQEDVASEPVFRSEKAKVLAKQSIELRYKLLPYNYNLAFENSQKGLSLMRPLFYEEENDITLTTHKSYFWGKDFLITPIVNPGVSEKDIYFPHDIWFDFYTDTEIEGGQSYSVTTQEESIPTYVRAGAFVPMVDVVQSTDQYTLDKFDLHYYYHDSITNSERTYYNDDGLTRNAYGEENFEILKFEAEQKNDWFNIDFEAVTARNYTSKTKSIDLIIHNIDAEPELIKIGSKRIKNSIYDREDHTLSIPVKWHTSKELQVKIKFNK